MTTPDPIRLLDRIRSLFSTQPKVGQPGTGTLMERGEGEMNGPIDETRDAAHHHDLGTQPHHHGPCAPTHELKPRRRTCPAYLHPHARGRPGLGVGCGHA